MKKVCVIGGSGGIGSQITKELLDNYEVVSLSSKDLDIRDFYKCKMFFEDNEFDIVINASGVNFDSFVHKIAQNHQYLINYLLDVNLKGTMNICATVLPGMRERGYGRIICISSVLAENNILGTAVYSACKVFIDRFIKSVSAENISKGITANSLRLGYFDAGLTYKLPNPDNFKEKIPLKRWGSIEELISAIDFIIGTEYLTGQNITIAGGV